MPCPCQTLTQSWACAVQHLSMLFQLCQDDPESPPPARNLRALAHRSADRGRRCPVRWQRRGAQKASGLDLHCSRAAALTGYRHRAGSLRGGKQRGQGCRALEACTVEGWGPVGLAGAWPRPHLQPDLSHVQRSSPAHCPAPLRQPETRAGRSGEAGPVGQSWAGAAGGMARSSEPYSAQDGP